ncbi:MAG: AAA family ATPase, partial [Microlunatus sp.]|nr:AAA family ATPase [Microlunatus sp.]
MTRSVFIASPEGLAGKSAIAIGLLDTLTREVGSIGVFRPLIEGSGIDMLGDMLLNQPGIVQSYDDAIGVTYQQAREDPDEAMHVIVEKFGRLSERFDVVLVLGSDYTDISTSTELTANARVAANLGAPVVLVVHGLDRSAAEVRATAELAMAELGAHHAHTVAVIANRIAPDELEATVSALAELPEIVVAAVPETTELSAPTVRAQAAAVDAPLVLGTDPWLDRESQGLIVAAMSLPNVLTRLRPDITVIAPGDRGELLPGLLLAHQSGTFPSLAGIVLTGGYPIPEPIQRLIEGVPHNLPIVSTELGTYGTASRLSTVRGPITKNSTQKLEVARRLFSERVDADALLTAIDVSASTVRTPLMFEFQLMERARAAHQHLV